MALPEDADAEEQLQELEALGSIFGEDLTVLNESPIELEIIVPLELGGARDLHVRVVPVDGISPGSGNSTVPSTADISLASSDDVRPCAVVSEENPQQEKETSVPEAIKYAEHVLKSAALSLLWIVWSLGPVVYSSRLATCLHCDSLSSSVIDIHHLSRLTSD